ncbi:hypothetical protein [Kineosporia sp. A_224]|uniref:hypothetical protein n=1 Tax=Kineosporia sp. A_224 TaxID=1962180 RepID=UPI0013042854|nr:hypothetical protein [Kineosporia sp. A_224]
MTAEVAADQQWRWWTPAGLAASAERLAPADLAGLVASVRRDGPPPVPLTPGI